MAPCEHTGQHTGPRHGGIARWKVDQTRQGVLSGSTLELRSVFGLGVDRPLNPGSYPVRDSTELLGRVGEQQTLTSTLANALASRGCTLVLRGAPGIGKTALLADVVTRAEERNLTVLSVTAVQTEAQLPYAGVHQLLGTLIEAQPAKTRQLWNAALNRPGEEESPVERFRLALAVLTAVTSKAGSGRLLVVDDAQWLDRESWDILAFVGRRIAGDRVCLLLGMRDGEEAEALLAGAGLPELQVGPLSADAAEALLRLVAPALSPELVQRVMVQAAGNPLGLMELGAAGTSMEQWTPAQEDLPLTARIERTYADAISQLPMRTQSLMLIAALGEGIQLREVITIATTMNGSDASVDDLEPAIAAGLLSLEGSSVQFRHPLIRWSVTRSATTSTRVATHAAIADALDSLDPRQIWHRAAATLGTDTEVADHLEQVATRAAQQGSLETALRAWEKSADLTPPGHHQVRRLIEAAHIAAQVSNRPKMTALLARIAYDDLDESVLTELELLRRQSDGVQWPYDKSFPPLVELAARLQAEGRTDLALQSLYVMSTLCWWVDLKQATRTRIVDMIASMGLPELDPMHAAVVAVVSPVHHGRESVARLGAVRVSVRDVNANLVLGTSASGIGDFRSSSAFLATATSAARKLGRLAVLTQALVSQALVAALLGDSRLALTSAEEAQRSAIDTNQPGWGVQARLVEALAMALTGRGSEALETADEVEALLLASGARAFVPQAAMIRGVAHLAQGRTSAAVDELSSLFSPGDLHYHEHMRYWAVSHLAEAAALSGRHDDLRAVVDFCKPVLVQAGWPCLEMSLTYAGALLAPDDEADAAFAGALDSVTADWPLERARVQLAYGAWLRRHRRAADSRKQLRAAQQAFEGLGIEPWAERAREELRASGEHPRRSSSALTTLTPQELQVARFAASGLSNPEIAAQLFLAPSTISTHLHRAYRKVGVTGRKQLAKALAEV